MCDDYLFQKSKILLAPCMATHAFIPKSILNENKLHFARDVILVLSENTLRGQVITTTLLPPPPYRNQTYILISANTLPLKSLEFFNVGGVVSVRVVLGRNCG